MGDPWVPVGQHFAIKWVRDAHTDGPWKGQDDFLMMFDKFLGTLGENYLYLMSCFGQLSGEIICFVARNGTSDVKYQFHNEMCYFTKRSVCPNSFL